MHREVIPHKDIHLVRLNNSEKEKKKTFMKTPAITDI